MRLLLLLPLLLLVGCAKEEPFQLECGSYWVIIDKQNNIFAHNVGNAVYAFKLLDTGGYWGFSDGRDWIEKRAIRKERKIFKGERCITVKLDTNLHNRAKGAYNRLYK